MDTANHQEFVVAEELFKSQSTEQRYTLTPFLIPNKADHQGDVIDAAEIERIVWGLGLHKKLMDEEHMLVNKQVGDPVEKYVLPADTLFQRCDSYSAENQARVAQIKKLQQEIVETGEARLIPKGTAMIGVIWKPEYWKQIKANKKQGLSIWGKGVRNEIAKSRLIAKAVAALGELEDLLKSYAPQPDSSIQPPEAQ